MFRGTLTLENDGVDHINVYSKAATVLGRLLSNFYPAAIHHPKYGFFASIEAFWYWARSGKKHDELRDLWGFEAKRVGKELPIVEYDGFRDEICEAIQLKLEQNPIIKQYLIDTELPLAHYYVYEGKQSAAPVMIPVPQFDWQIEFIESLRKRYKEAV